MLLMFSVGAQAVHVLLFFSPSAASAAEPLTPPAGSPGLPAGQIGPHSGPVLAGPGPEWFRARAGQAAAGGRAGLLPFRGRLAVLAGPGRARTRLAPGGLRRQAGVAAGPPESGRQGLCSLCLRPLGRYTCCVCLCWRVCVLLWSPTLGAPRTNVVEARLAGILVAPRGKCCAVLRPSFCCERVLARTASGPSASELCPYISR